jgi:hypothetical protein
MREAIEHKWARNTDPDKHGKQSKMSFRGMAAYSYATVVACKYPNKKGDGGVCVIAGEGIRNSSRTMRHRLAFHQALPISWTRIWVDLKQGYGYSHGEDLTSMPGLRHTHEYGKTCVKELAEKVKKAKSYAIRARAWEKFQYKRARVNDLGRFLKRDDLLPAQYGLDWKAEDANLARWTAKVSGIQRTKTRREEKSFEERLADWRARKISKLLAWNHPGFYLRMSRDKKYVETSRGAVVPVGDARKLFKLCDLVRLGAGYVYSSSLAVSVGPYALRIIEPNGDCVVGCHTLKYEEMEALHLANPEPEETK